MENDKKLVTVLSAIAVVLILVISLTGIIADDGGDPYVFKSLHEQEVKIYGGHGPYRYDSVYKAVAIRGYDWVNLVVSLPLLVLGTRLYRRSQLKGQLLLAAVFYHQIPGVDAPAFRPGEEAPHQRVSCISVVSVV